jgi:acetyl-CoA carboxylase carboxyltransferase component
MYQIRTIITQLVDQDSWLEIGPYWGTTVILGLARLHGRPVAIIANNPEVDAGALNSAGAQKIAKHLKLCDVMGLPIVQLVDIPGFAVGTVAEKSGVMKWGTDLFKTYYTTSIPIFTIVVRRCYGIAGSILADCRAPRARVAWLVPHTFGRRRD